MAQKNEIRSNDPEQNPDPITKEPGSHPVGTGLGAAGVGLAATAAGTAIGGPVGGVIGALAGGLAGGAAGKAAAEAVDPTAEESYWREHHQDAQYAGGRSYDDYHTAYRTGYEGYGRYGAETDYETIEPKLRQDYEASEAPLPWDEARHATRAAWNRVHTPRPRDLEKSGAEPQLGGDPSASGRSGL